VAASGRATQAANMLAIHQTRSGSARCEAEALRSAEATRKDGSDEWNESRIGRCRDLQENKQPLLMTVEYTRSEHQACSAHVAVSLCPNGHL
jgi:hypothetical protein